MNVPEILSFDVEQRVKNGAVLIDVREPFEFMFGYIPGSINIPLSQFLDRLNELPNENIVLICRSGGRSEEAGRYLLQNGYTNVANLIGGTMGWKAAGFHLDTPPQAK